MNLSTLKSILAKSSKIEFKLPNGTLVPSHFHVTEVGKITKHFIDCGGTERKEVTASLQLWEANDYDHRLHPEKLQKIIELSQEKLGLGNVNLEVEYQGETIGKYDLDHDGQSFLLTNKQTDCLAKENCGVPSAKVLPVVELSDLSTSQGQACTPGGGCC